MDLQLQVLFLVQSCCGSITIGQDQKTKINIMGHRGTASKKHEGYFQYDFGDNWIVKIIKCKDCEDLLKNNIIDEYELEEGSSARIWAKSLDWSTRKVSNKMML